MSPTKCRWRFVAARCLAAAGLVAVYVFGRAAVGIT
jgi:hypothetical protein